MRQVLVGYQLLGRRPRRRTLQRRKSETKSSFLPWQAFTPLVTPPVRRQKDDFHESASTNSTERFILLPSQHFITVMAYKTGKTIAFLVPFDTSDDDNEKGRPLITSAAVATFPGNPLSAERVLDRVCRKVETSNLSNQQEDDDEEKEEASDEVLDDWYEDHVLLVGCDDGTLREFSLVELTKPQIDQQLFKKSPCCGPYQLNGICHAPRRVFNVCCGRPIIHLSSVEVNMAESKRLVVYAITSEEMNIYSNGTLEGGGDDASSCEYALRRIRLSNFTDATDNENMPFETIILDRLKNDVFPVDVDNSPFALEATLRDSFALEQDNENRQTVFVVVARPSQVMIYTDYFTEDDDGVTNKLQFPPVRFMMSGTNYMTALAISTNGKDIACGHSCGEIRILCDALTAVVNYNHARALRQNRDVGIDSTSPPKHPSKTIVTRRVHWHAHPVASLAYQFAGSLVDPILHSGGDESVLVTWQLSRGTYRPADVLARLSKGGIIAIRLVNGGEDGPSGILVATEDNTLQLFESHNRALLWKVQGLAFRSTIESSVETPVQSRVWSDPRGDASVLVLTGLPDAPGYIHWYDTREQRVSRALEVASYNRVSKVEREDSSMPAPAISHCAFSENGDDMVTVDVTPTENTSIGAFMLQDGNSPVGTVSTIRFWSYSTPKRAATEIPYQFIAAMSFPHGPNNFVSAISLSRDGTCCCSVSNGEKAIRIWQKTDVADGQDEDFDVHGRQRPLWLGRYRITFPSGFSNLGVRAGGVAFSTDGSILVICFGNYITLWDHRESSFLTSLLHIEDDRAPIDTIQFLSLDSALDMILTKSSSGVALQSPFARYGSSQGWSWALPSTTKDTTVVDAHIIRSHRVAAISTYCCRSNESRIVFIDIHTGDPIKDDDEVLTPSLVKLKGKVISVASNNKRRSPSLPYNQAKEGFQFSVLTNQGELISVKNDDTVDDHIVGDEVDISQGSKVPRLPPESLLDAGRPAKRQKTIQHVREEISQTNFFGASFGNFTVMDSSSVPVSTVDLPSLSGRFARAFVGRNLARRHQVSS